MPTAGRSRSSRIAGTVAAIVSECLGEIRPPRTPRLTAILTHTAAANAALDAQAERFDRLRDLERQAAEVLAGLERRLSKLEISRTEAERLLGELVGEYAASALAPVAAAPAEAGLRMEFAREHVKAGRDDVDAGRNGDAAIEVLVAEEAVGPAQQLVDSVVRLHQDLSDARSRIDEAVAETRRDIAEAKASAAAGLKPLVATAEAALTATADAAAPEGGRDPLAALRRLKDADDALEQALQPVRDEQVRRAKAVESLERTLVAARSEVASATDFITTHRGAVRSGPRTRLAEAQRHLDDAVALRGSDPQSAAQHAAQAGELAQRAFTEARDQTRETAAAQGGSGVGGNLAGAVLDGILVGEISRSGGRGSGSGRLAPPSFGGEVRAAAAAAAGGSRRRSQITQ